MDKNRKKFKGTYFISSISQTSSICEFGISSIFILFLIYVLHFSIPLTSKIFAYYYGFAYIIPILIGFISDKYLKKNTSLTIGFILMIISQLILYYSASLYVPNNLRYDTVIFNSQTIAYFTGLFFLAIGTSFTNNTIPNIINSINYGDAKIQGISIYYSILNQGVLLGVLIMFMIVGRDYYLYKWGFLAFAIILSIGLIAFKLLKNKFLIDNDGNIMEDDQPQMILKNLTIKDINLIKRIKQILEPIDSHQKDKLKVFLIFLVMIIIFRTAYSQTNISMVFFIDNYIQRDLGFYEIPVNLFFILNPIYIIILTPIFTKITNRINEKKYTIGYTERILIGLLFMALCFTILAINGYYLDTGIISKIPILLIILFDFLLALSELCISIAGYSMVGDLTNENLYSLFFGIFTATRAVSMYLSGMISRFFPDLNQVTSIGSIPFNGLMNYFFFFAFINFISAVILFIFRNNINRKMHLDEA